MGMTLLFMMAMLMMVLMLTMMLMMINVDDDDHDMKYLIFYIDYWRISIQERWWWGRSAAIATFICHNSPYRLYTVYLSSNHPFNHLSIHSYIHGSIHPFICPSIDSCIHPFIYITIVIIHTFIYLSFYPLQVDYIGFHIVTPMPYACSDMTAVTFDTDFDDNEGPRIYLSGGMLMLVDNR